MPDLKFQFMVDYFGSLSRHIVKKQYVNGEMLAEALRKKESLPFPETLLDYLCRFLENEIKRGRGRPKAPNFKEPHSGNTCHCRLEHVTKRIESGDKVSGSELTDILRSEAVGEIPDRMLEYLCQFLTVSVKKPGAGRQCRHFQSAASSSGGMAHTISLGVNWRSPRTLHSLSQVKSYPRALHLGKEEVSKVYIHESLGPRQCRKSHRRRLSATNCRRRN